MRKISIISIFFCLAIFFSLATQTRAQQVWGVSIIAWDDQVPLVAGLSGTYLDYYSGIYYDPWVYGCLYSTDLEFGCLSEGTMLGYADWIPAEVYHPTMVVPRNEIYCTYSVHRVEAAFFNYYYYDWWDAWWYSRFSPGPVENNSPWGGYFSYVYRPRSITLGWTEACHYIPPPPTPTPTPSPTPCDPGNPGALPCQTPTPTPTPSPTASIVPLDYVEKFSKAQGSVTFANATNAKLTIETKAGTTGSAQFETSSGGTANEITVAGNAATNFTIVGINQSNQVDNIVIRAKMTVNSTESELDFEELTVATITSLVFQKFHSTSEEIIANPGNGVTGTNQGVRIFPDKKDVADATTGTIDRDVVNVKATIAPAMAGVKVNFRTYDLDDPSSTTRPLEPISDTTGKGGDDNNGTVAGGTKAGLLFCTSCTTSTDRLGACPTETDGTFTAMLRVTMQPGDNFAVVASLTEDYLTSITFDSTDGAKLVKPAVGSTPQKEIPISGTAGDVPAIRTTMLTVWRTLHIEADSMNNVPNNCEYGNCVSGTVPSSTTVATNTSAPFQTISLQVTNALHLDLNRFESGRIDFGSRSFKVKTNTVSNPLVGDSSIRIGRCIPEDEPYGCPTPTPRTPTPTPTPTATPTPSPSPTPTPTPTRTVDITVENPGTPYNITAGQAFTLYDDDDFNNSDVGSPDGDLGEPIPAPDTTSSSSLLIAASDTSCSATVTGNCNILAPAYIRIAYDLPNPNPSMNFVLNLPMTVDILAQPPVQGDVTVAYKFDNRSLESRPDFWTIYLGNGYQVDGRWDNDPNGEGGVGGITDATNGNAEGTILFLENLRAREAISGWGTTPITVDYTLAHEVGHIFNGRHEDVDATLGITNAGLMATAAPRTVGGVVIPGRNVGTFNDITLFKIRGGSWGGVRISHP